MTHRFLSIATALWGVFYVLRTFHNFLSFYIELNWCVLFNVITRLVQIVYFFEFRPIINVLTKVPWGDQMKLDRIPHRLQLRHYWGFLGDTKPHLYVTLTQKNHNKHNRHHLAFAERLTFSISDCSIFLLSDQLTQIPSLKSQLPFVNLYCMTFWQCCYKSHCEKWILLTYIHPKWQMDKRLWK